MIEFFDCVITYLDGSTETIKGATSQRVHEGVLYLYRQNGSYAQVEHMGSWPLTSIRKWRKM